MDALFQFYFLWILVGIVLMVGYAYLGTSFVFWVAGGLTLVALLPIPIPQLSDLYQLVIWGAAALLYLLIWVFIIKPLGIDKTDDELNKVKFVGAVGQITQVHGEDGLTLVSFPYPIEGVSLWPVFPLEEIVKGDKVEVVNLRGRALVVKKVESLERD